MFNLLDTVEFLGSLVSCFVVGYTVEWIWSSVHKKKFNSWFPGLVMIFGGIIYIVKYIF